MARIGQTWFPRSVIHDESHRTRRPDQCQNAHHTDRCRRRFPAREHLRGQWSAAESRSKRLLGRENPRIPFARLNRHGDPSHLGCACGPRARRVQNWPQAITSPDFSVTLSTRVPAAFLVIATTSFSMYSTPRSRADLRHQSNTAVASQNPSSTQIDRAQNNVIDVIERIGGLDLFRRHQLRCAPARQCTFGFRAARRQSPRCQPDTCSQTTGSTDRARGHHCPCSAAGF